MIRVIDRRIAALEAQRVKWAEDTIDGAVPRDVAKAKQGKIATELTLLETERKTCRRVVDKHQQAIRNGMMILRDMPDGYEGVDPALRRSYNQACFEYIVVDDLHGQPTTTSVSFQPEVADIRKAATNMALAPNSSVIESNSYKEAVNRCDIRTTGNPPFGPVRTSDTRTKPETAMIGIAARQEKKMLRTVACKAVLSPKSPRYIAHTNSCSCI